MKQITIAGNIGRDAVLRRTQGGDPVAGFSVAVSDRKKNTTWFGCSVWGKRGEALCQHLTKGKSVTVVGDLSTREHDGKTYLEINVSEITMHGGGRSEGGQSGHVADTSGVSGGYDGGMPDDDIPFAPEWRI